MTESPRVRIKPRTHDKATAEKGENDSIGDVIEGWRRDAELLRALKRTDFAEVMDDGA